MVAYMRPFYNGIIMGNLLIYILFQNRGWRDSTTSWPIPKAALQAPLFINSTNHLPQTDYYP